MDATPILSDVSPPQLLQACKRNLHQYLLGVRRAPEVVRSAGPGWARWRVPGVPHPWFNALWCGEALAGEALTSLAEQALEDLRASGVRSATWWLDPQLEREAFRPALEAAGFQFSDDLPGMGLPLVQLPVAPPLPPGAEIVTVTDAAGLNAWVRVFIKGYGMPAGWLEPCLDLFAGMGLDLPYRYYLCLLDGEPVATSSLFLADGVAGVYCVATLPAARGRGLGSALTLAPLVEARTLGYQAGILQSSEMGFPVYRRLGFEHLGGVDSFYWQE